jgi:hypothetical protein
MYENKDFKERARTELFRVGPKRSNRKLVRSYFEWVKVSNKKLVRSYFESVEGRMALVQLSNRLKGTD